MHFNQLVSFSSISDSFSFSWKSKCFSKVDGVTSKIGGVEDGRAVRLRSRSRRGRPKAAGAKLRLMAFFRLGPHQVSRRCFLDWTIMDFLGGAGWELVMTFI